VVTISVKGDFYVALECGALIRVEASVKLVEV
jgi:hypothetical protein